MLTQLGAGTIALSSPASASTAGHRDPDDILDITDFGGKGDWTDLQDAMLDGQGHLIRAADILFDRRAVGKRITIHHASSRTAAHSTHVKGVTECGAIVLAAAAPAAAGSVSFGIGTDNTKALRNALDQWRTPDRATTVNDPRLGRVPFYRGGTINFPAGAFSIDGGTMVEDVMGLRFQGQGSRGPANFQTGVSRIVFAGQTGTLLELRGNGARGFTANDIDFEYGDPGFTGDVLGFGATGVHLTNCFIGGAATAKRSLSPAALVRVSGIELVKFDNTFFDGAQHGLILDRGVGGRIGVRNLSIIGGAFFDFAQRQVFCTGGGNLGCSIQGTGFDPINTRASIALDLNFDGFVVEGCTFQGARAAAAPLEAWCHIAGRGAIRGNHFGAGSNGARIDGTVDVAGNFFAGNNGLELGGGVFSIGANQYAVSGKGVSVYPAGSRGACSFTAATASFTPASQYSYYFESDRAPVHGKIVYDPAQDRSVNKIHAAPPGVTVETVGKGGNE